MGGKLKHGMSRSPEYKAYTQALYRCTRPNEQCFKHYGGRGIKFLFKDFESFYKELGPRPKGLELERINNDGHYEPGNVKWASRTEQLLNRRTHPNATGFRGVRRDKKKYVAQICINYHNYHLGTFNTAKEAALAYQQALLQRTTTHGS